jgi:ribosomal protein S27AE
MSNISLRNMKVGYTEAREALDEFFEQHTVCPRCKGKGYQDSKKLIQSECVTGNSPMKLDISRSAYLVKNKEKIEKLSEVAKDAIYRQLGLRKTCTKCGGDKFIEK